MGILVIDPIEKSRVPFLRGILTRSLRVAGLSFSEAYDLANDVRNRLGTDSEISTDALTDLVASLLDERGKTEVLEAYLRGPQLRSLVLVNSGEDRLLYFSRAHLSRSLNRCGLSDEECEEVAAEIEQEIITTGKTEISSQVIAEIAYNCLIARGMDDMARRYLVWLEFFRNDRTLLILVGGTTGSGKSTFCSEIAHRLGIVRSQSTDMLREVMRVMPASDIDPALLKSSFDAWEALPNREDQPKGFRERVVKGYLAQSRAVGIAIEGALRRAEREQIALILEGVHVTPELQQQMAESIDGIVVPAILAVPKRKWLRKQLKGRGKTVPSRRAKRYLKHFDAIWELQSYLMDEAERLDVPIIPNVEDAETIQLFMETISERLEEHYNGDPKRFFGENLPSN